MKAKWILTSFLGGVLLLAILGARQEEIPETCNWSGVKIPSLPLTSVQFCRDGVVTLSQTAWVAGTCKVGLFTLHTGPNGLHWVTSSGEMVIHPAADPTGMTADYPKGSSRSSKPTKGQYSVYTYYEKDSGQWRLSVISAYPLRSLAGECRAGGYLK